VTDYDLARIAREQAHQAEGRFAREMQRQIEAARKAGDPGKAGELEEAAALGLDALRGIPIRFRRGRGAD
jgi:hypothetical protein